MGVVCANSPFTWLNFGVLGKAQLLIDDIIMTSQDEQTSLSTSDLQYLLVLFDNTNNSLLVPPVHHTTPHHVPLPLFSSIPPPHTHTHTHT